MKNFYPGKIVQVVKDLPECASLFKNIPPFNSFEKERAKFCGKFVTIDVCLKKGYLIKEDKHLWLWSEDMFI